MNGDHGERKETAGKETILMKEDSIWRRRRRSIGKNYFTDWSKGKDKWCAQSAKRKSKNWSFPTNGKMVRFFLLSKDFMGWLSLFWIESRGNDAKKIQNSILKEKRERKHTEKYLVRIIFADIMLINRDNQSSKQCKICYAQIQSWANYCSRCAYKKGMCCDSCQFWCTCSLGICARCGRKIQDTKMQKMSN